MNYTPFRAAALSSAAFLALSLLNLVRVRADVPAPANTPDSRISDGSAPPPANQPAAYPSEAAATRHSTRGEYLARTALSYRGLRYRFGGESPRGGFDCSGLVQTVCSKWGIYLPRAANAQYGVGKAIPRDQLEPGDLVFFKNTYKRGLSHVGIYVGNHLFLHAAGRRLGVMVSSLNSAYNLNHWAGARRLNLSKLPPVSGERQVVDRVILDSSDEDEVRTDLLKPDGALTESMR